MTRRSIQADLERLDEFDDGVVTYVDAGKLLALRLTEAGFDVTLDEYPGGHQAKNKLSELIGYFEAAASG
jgi:enterochelin esterase-like enzyme